MIVAAGSSPSLYTLSLEALQQREWKTARSGLEQFFRAGGIQDTRVWINLAIACRGLKDAEAEMHALDRALEFNPLNVLALVYKGDLYHDKGDFWTASNYYKRADSARTQPGAALTELGPLMARAQERRAQYAAHYAQQVEQQLAVAGFDPKTSSPRFAQSVDIAMGRKQIFLQEPSRYYFPGLPQVQFYEREPFPWLPALEAATADIRGELVGLLDQPGAFVPYIDDHSPHQATHSLVNNPDWSAFYLWRNGAAQEEGQRRCPKTVAAMRNVPLDNIENNTPSVLFSLLRPGARITPHRGMLNTRLICHLPLIVPPGCGIRVGNETRHWSEGQTLIFDDSIEHEAWNTSDQLRVVLIFDIWRPELTIDERHLISAIIRTTKSRIDS